MRNAEFNDPRHVEIYDAAAPTWEDWNLLDSRNREPIGAQDGEFLVIGRS